MKPFESNVIDRIILDCQREAERRRWAFFIRNGRNDRDKIACLHPYPTSSGDHDPEFHYLKFDPLTGYHVDIQQSSEIDVLKH